MCVCVGYVPDFGRLKIDQITNIQMLRYSINMYYMILYRKCLAQNQWQSLSYIINREATKSLFCSFVFCFFVLFILLDHGISFTFSSLSSSVSVSFSFF